jgi:hypothetical protein
MLGQLSLREICQAQLFIPRVLEKPLFEKPLFEKPLFEKPLFEKPLFENPRLQPY